MNKKIVWPKGISSYYLEGDFNAPIWLCRSYIDFFNQIKTVGVLDRKDFICSNTMFKNCNLQELQNDEFDLVVVYDVLDHLDDQNSLHEYLNSMKQKSKYYLIRFHPYQSRLGNHLFDENKAYLHLIKNICGKHTLLFDKITDYSDVCNEYFDVINCVYNTEIIESFFDKYQNILNKFDRPDVQYVDLILKDKKPYSNHKKYIKLL